LPDLDKIAPLITRDPSQKYKLMKKKVYLMAKNQTQCKYLQDLMEQLKSKKDLQELNRFVTFVHAEIGDRYGELM
jgi:thioredoxin-related protein